MSQTPWPGQPVPYYGGTPPRRPGVVTAMAVLGIIFGALLLFCNPFIIIALVGAVPVNSPELTAMRNDSVIYTWGLVGSVLRILAGLVLVIGSIGALRLAEWGRRMLFGFIGLMLLVAVIDIVITLVHIVPLQSRSPAMGSLGGAVFGWFLWIGYSLALLGVLLQANVRAAFAGAAAPGYVPGYPPAYPPMYPPPPGPYPPPPGSAT